MADTSLTTTVNKHFLCKVLDLAGTMDVVATADLTLLDGTKVLRQGGKIARSLAASLVQSKLTKPIETSLMVQGGIEPHHIVDIAARLMETSAPLARILRASGGQGSSPLGILSGMEFGNGISLMLTIMDRDGSGMLEHSVLVSLLSICFAKKLRLTEDDQCNAAIAGLLHDLGELYIDPAFLAKGVRLAPHEWAHIVLHPRIGQMLINELESYPLAVGRAVAEHHERFDGTGYPRQVAGHALSAIGQAVGVAEMVAGVLVKDFPLERAELALKIIPGEHSHDLLSAISGALRSQGKDAPQAVVTDLGDDVERLFWRITSTLETGQNLLDAPSARSPRSTELLKGALTRVKTVQRAFISTGLDIYLRQNHGMHEHADHGILFERAVASREIRWRLRDIARDLALHAGTPSEKTVFAPMINLLDDDNPVLRPVVVMPEKPKAMAPKSFPTSASV